MITRILAMSLLVSTAAFASDFTLDSQNLTFQGSGGRLVVSLQCPRLVFEGLEPVGGGAPASTTGDLSSGEPLKVTYAPLTFSSGETAEVTLFLQWSADEQVLRKWAEVRMKGNASPSRLDEVIFQEFAAANLQREFLPVPPQSYPIFVKGFFAGVEHPVASTRIEGDRVLLAHRPAAALQSDRTYKTRAAVYGMAQPGLEVEAFQRYILAHRPGKPGVHVNYNSWWTSSVPFTETEILGLMLSFHDELHAPHGVALDTFTIDMGWSKREGLWEIDPALFPQGFTPIQQAAESMGARLGLWISPSNFYSPASFDNTWAKEQGYETLEVPGANGTVKLCCLGGERYATAFRERLVEFLTRYNIGQVKLDGYNLVCSETDHGHAPGMLSAEAVAEGGIRAFEAMRKARPDVWLEATCFGWNPSPWWLFYVDSVIGTFGDDAPRGRVPAPVYRESYTTGRDFFNLQGADRLAIPAAAQEVLGVIHQTADPFLNDAVVAFTRGHAFVPLYVHPKYMNERRWKALADLIQWTRLNPRIYEHTEPILPPHWRDGRTPKFTNDAAMPREPYGYAHWREDGGLVTLRNPWIKPASASIALPDAKGLSAVSLYPEPRLYGKDLAAGSTLEVPLAPYETVVLAVAPGLSLDGLPAASDRVGRKITVADTQPQLRRMRFEGPAERFGPDWTVLTEPGAEAAELRLSARVEVSAPQARLLVLLEGPETPTMPSQADCRINGAAVELKAGSSDAGWSATGLPPGPDRWLFLEAPLPQGGSDVALDLVTNTSVSSVSVWTWATRDGVEGSPCPNALPEPELVSLDAAPLLSPGAIPGGDAEVRPAVVERIQGVYLDTLEPASATQEYGTLQRNRSVTEVPLVIGSQSFLRGLGTHANSRIVFDLDGTTYTRFTAFAGGQKGYNATIALEVRVDGEKVWESGPMTSADEPKPVDVDLRGAKRLELVATDGGNGIGADHANWANAILRTE